MGQNYFQNRDFAADANLRSNDLNVANVGLIGSAAGLNDADAGLVDAQGRAVDADTTQALPARVALTRSQGRNLDAQSATEDAMRGVRVGQGNLQIAQGRTLLPTMGEAAANEVAAGRLALAERRALLPGLVARQAAETGAMTAQADASRAVVDPASALAADKAAFDLASQMAQQEYEDQSNWRYLFGWLPGVDGVKGKGELTQQHLQRLRPTVNGGGGGGGTGAGGKKVVRRGREKGTGRIVVEYGDGTREYAS
jgi:hypothetical protein